MHLTELTISNFRCIRHLEIKPTSGINLILGPNGAGKTSILESIFCLSRGRSFRANNLVKLIQDAQSSCIVRAKLESDITHQLALQAFRDQSNAKYQAKIDGEPVKSLAELSRILPAIILDPAIHKLIEDGPSLRRQFLDWGVFHVEPQFMQEWRRYQRALKQRNVGLKKGISQNQLQAWTDILITSGLYIDQARKNYIDSLLPNVAQIATELLDTDIKLTYRSGWAKELSFTEAIEKSRQREQKTSLTLVGPHRADLVIQVGDLEITRSEETDTLDDSSDEAFYKVQQRVSRGQQKLIAASLILSQALHFKEKHQIPPILLIDDPFAELDTNHSNRLLQEINKLNAQTFITTLNSLDHPIFKNAKKFHVEHGEITKNN
jgi:DNA replication and repair protein RecF